MNTMEYIQFPLGLLIGLLNIYNAEIIRTKVAVLGGGMAGVMAAKTLFENGISKFLLIDAKLVLGGRMKETKFAVYTTELDANWVQGTRNNETGKENPMWTLAQKYNPTNTYSDYDDILTYDQTGSVNYSNVIRQAFAAFDQVMDDAGVRNSLNLEDLSFAQGQNPREWTPRTSHEQVAEWWAFDFEYTDTPAASSMIEMAVNNNSSFVQWSDDNQFVIDQRDFGFLVREEAKQFASGQNMLLNSTVTKIEHSNISVHITLKDGRFTVADYAICTFFIGILQYNDVLFIPSFPLWKNESILTFKMATYTKIF